MLSPGMSWERSQLARAPPAITAGLSILASRFPASSKAGAPATSAPRAGAEAVTVPSPASGSLGETVSRAPLVWSYSPVSRYHRRRCRIVLVRTETGPSTVDTANSARPSARRDSAAYGPPPGSPWVMTPAVSAGQAVGHTHAVNVTAAPIAGGFGTRP